MRDLWDKTFYLEPFVSPPSSPPPSPQVLGLCVSAPAHQSADITPSSYQTSYGFAIKYFIYSMDDMSNCFKVWVGIQCRHGLCQNEKYFWILLLMIACKYTSQFMKNIWSIKEKFAGLQKKKHVWSWMIMISLSRKLW